MIGHARAKRRNEICKGEVRLLVWLDRLLTQHVKAYLLAAAGLVAPDDDVVAVPVRGPETVHGARGDQPLRNDAVEQRAAVIVELTCRSAVALVVENLRKLTP